MSRSSRDPRRRPRRQGFGRRSTAPLTPFLHKRFPALAEALPHLVLSERPTPVRELAGLGIWVKEDGSFGSGGWGGNKVRELEWLIPDAAVAARSSPSAASARTGGWRPRSTP